MKIIPNIQHIENDLIRRVILCILYPILLASFIPYTIIEHSIRFVVELYRDIVHEFADIWKTSPYRKNKYIWR